MKAYPSCGGKSKPINPTIQTVFDPQATCKMQSTGFKTYLSEPKVKVRSGNLSMVVQSTCFSFPGPKAQVILSMTFFGPAMTDVPVSMMADKVPFLYEVPLKLTSLISKNQQFCIFNL